MKLGVFGCAGRMGRALIRAVHEKEGAVLWAATERPGFGMNGADAGQLAGVGPLGVTIGNDTAAFADCDAVLDFTAPEASTELAGTLAGMGVGHVIGTTGFAADQDEAIVAHCDKIPIVKSGNMSLGVNLLAALVERAARSLPDADLEVLEMHHRRKVDAPSGTALLLGNAA
ncbi:MAG: 4-hydroxy-tetrahydrodipicolinate reductase, partial [Pseudomonadota bacterium]